MVMENKNNKLIDDFFTQHKNEISDNEFSHNVIKSLPEKEKNHWIIPVFALVGFYFSLFLIDSKELALKVYYLVIQINPLYFVIFLFSIPFIFLFLWFANEKKHLFF